MLLNKGERDASFIGRDIFSSYMMLICLMRKIRIFYPIVSTTHPIEIMMCLVDFLTKFHMRSIFRVLGVGMRFDFYVMSRLFVIATFSLFECSGDYLVYLPGGFSQYNTCVSMCLYMLRYRYCLVLLGVDWLVCYVVCVCLYDTCICLSWS